VPTHNFTTQVSGLFHTLRRFPWRAYVDQKIIFHPGGYQLRKLYRIDFLNSSHTFAILVISNILSGEPPDVKQGRNQRSDY